MSLSSAAIITQSGLATVTAEIAVLSRNISSNNDTSFYSRKLANVSTTASGAQVMSITRASNQAVFDNMLSATSANAAQEAILAGLDTLNQTIGDVSAATPGSTSSASSPAARISQFADALQAYSASPTDLSAAAAVVSAASALSATLNSASATVQQLRETADSGMAAAVASINSLLGQFKVVNQQVVSGTALAVDITDAQDQRDSILQQLSQEVGISTSVAANGDMSVYTESGVTLFQGGVAATATFASQSAYAAGTVGRPVFVDGVAITGTSAVMPIASGRLGGLVAVRDATTVSYQAQLDNMAGALVGGFAESDQTGPGPDLPGLFTTAGAASMPAAVVGLASQLSVNPTVDPNQGGDLDRLRDGGVSNPSNSGYVYNSTGAASFTGRISQLIGALSATQSFGAAGGLSTSATLGDYAAASVSWLEAQRSSASTQGSFHSALLSTATTALSNATGVNINDQMAQMLDLENSYAASAKLLTAINSMFNDLLAAIH